MTQNKVMIFLDDYRNPQDCLSYMHSRIGKHNPLYAGKWLVVRDFKEFQQAIDTHAGNISHISYDHDLADDHYATEMYSSLDEYLAKIGDSKEKTGYECACYMLDVYTKHNHPLPIIFVHSMNPAGTKRISDLFKYHKHE